jgi:hypothetical protein
MLKLQPLPQLEAQLQAVLIEHFSGNCGIVMHWPVGLTNNIVY